GFNRADRGGPPRTANQQEWPGRQRPDRPFTSRDSRNMKKLIGGLIAGAALAFAAATAQAQDVVKVGVAAEPYPPFSEKDAAGNWVGFEMDLYKAVCEDQKLKCELVEVAWDGIIPALQEKKIDVIWSSMSITDERKQVIDFTDMYYDSANVLIGAKSDDAQPDSTKPDSLKGKIIGVQTSTIHATSSRSISATL